MKMKRIKLSYYVLLVSAFILLCPSTVFAGALVIDNCYYGDSSIYGSYYGFGETDIKIVAYKGTASEPGNETTYPASISGSSYQISLPDYWSIGTPFTVRCTSRNSYNQTDNAVVEYDTIKAPEDVWLTYWDITYKSKKIKVRLENVHSGDILKIKVGKKTYKKKIKADTADITYRIKIKKPTAGKKITFWVVNKYNQVLVSPLKTIVFKYKSVKKGMTKKQARLAIGWRDPTHINYYTYSEQWCYDDDGDGYTDSYLYFNGNGRVTGWQIYN